MKKYSIITSLCMLLALFSSCNDDFMQRDPMDQMADGNFFTKEADLQLYLDGIYRYFVTGHGIGGTNNSSHDKGFLPVRAGSQIIYADAFSDNVVYAGGIDSKLGGTYDTPTSASKNFDTAWNWEKLRKVNYFLNHYKQVTDADPEALAGYAAQAYFFKAWDYYIKLLAMGEVPWLTKELDTSSPEMYGPRTPRPELVDSIMMCLNFAVEHLEDNDNSCGRINQDQALFLKARFCLFEGTFRKYHTELNLQSTADEFLRQARDAARTIMDKGRYKLFDNGGTDSYYQLFIQKQTPEADGNDETILARVYDGVKLGNDNPRYMGKNNHTRYAMGAPLCAIEEYLCEDGRPIYIGGTEGNWEVNPLFKGYDGMWEELDNRDPRLRQTICKPGEYASIFDADDYTYTIEESGIIFPMVTYDTGGGSPLKQYNSTVTGYRFIKHWMSDMEGEWNANADGRQTAHMFRYAELLLIYAEARAELNEITNEDLDETVNALRLRAGFDFDKYPNARLTLQNIPADPRLDAIFAQYLDYSVSPILREIRRERRVEMMLEGERYEDLMRWKAGKFFTIQLRGMKMTDAKVALYSKNRQDEAYTDEWGNHWDKVTVPIAEVGNTVRVDNDGFIIPWPTSTTVIDGIRPWDDKRYYYPIPLNEMLMNPQLTQNPGWKDISR